VQLAALRIGQTVDANALPAGNAVRLKRFLRERAHGGGLQNGSAATATGSSATAALRLSFDGFRERKSGKTVFLPPRVDLFAKGYVGDENFVFQRLACEGRGVVLRQPQLDLRAVVRVAVRSDDGVVHQRAIEGHVFELI
jgi:hypothetical protein